MVAGAFWERRLVTWVGDLAGTRLWMGGGGDPEMAVPGLAAFLAFLSRPQTLVAPGGGGWAGREEALTLALSPPFPFLPRPPISLSHFTAPPWWALAWDCVRLPPSPPPGGGRLGLPGTGGHAGAQGQTI